MLLSLVLANLGRKLAEIKPKNKKVEILQLLQCQRPMKSGPYPLQICPIFT